MKNNFLLFFCLTFAHISTAQDTTAFHFSLNHLSLCVKDVDKAAEFYGQTMQLPEITNRTKVKGIRWFSLGEGKELHLISTLNAPFLLNKAIHFALTVPDFDTFLKALQQKNVIYSDWNGTPNTVNLRADGIKQIYFQDPDGYWIEINSVGKK